MFVKIPEYLLRMEQLIFYILTLTKELKNYLKSYSHDNDDVEE